jgi:RNA polymerase sigma-70 factor (ECF subfamily)
VLQVFKTDSEIARDLLSGDEAAFTEFVHAFRVRLAQYSFLMCGHHEDAEEVAQETLMKVFESVDQLQDPDRLKSWVFRIAKNQCLMKRRKSVFAPSIVLSLDEWKPGEDGAGRTLEIPDCNALPDRLLLTSELHEALARSIQSLPETYRSVVLLRDIEEFSTEDTAGILEITPESVRTRLHRGRALLREQLNGYLRAAGGPAWRPQPIDPDALAGLRDAYQKMLCRRGK